MTVWQYLQRSFLGTILSMVLLAAIAQDVRDPTVAPADGATMPGASASAAPTQSTTIIVQDGKSYLVVGTRLVAIGQKVGTAKLERITETEIWLREGRQLTKVARFNGIRRTVATPLSVCGPTVRKRASKPTRTPVRTGVTQSATPEAAHFAAPCEGGQP